MGLRLCVTTPLLHCYSLGAELPVVFVGVQVLHGILLNKVLEVLERAHAVVIETHLVAFGTAENDARRDVISVKNDAQ